LGVDIGRLLMYLFLLAVAGYGVLGLIAPHRLVQRKGEWWFFDWMTGRVLYTSITRVRLVCGVLFVMAVGSISVAVFQRATGAY
jgi:hypothetical protein